MNERIGTHLTPEEAQEINKGFMGTFAFMWPLLWSPMA